MANLHISATTEIGNTGITLLEFLNQYNQKRLPHYIETQTTYQSKIHYMNLGRHDDNPQYGKLLHKSGYNNNMTEFYGGVHIPDISLYHMLIVEVNYGGNGNSQLSGGIYLWNSNTNTYDSDYNTSWAEQILMPPTTNYTKISINKTMLVDGKTGAYNVCCLLNTYSGEDIGWNVGFGDGGTKMKVIGILK